MDGYWSARPSELVRHEIMLDWMAALENFTQDQIRAACRDYLAGPDRKTKPKVGDIVDILVPPVRLRSLPNPHEERVR